MGNRYIDPNPQYLDDSGNVLGGGTLTFYTTSTTTLTAIYTSAALSSQQSNPVTLDAAGRAPVIYLDPATTYKVVLKDSLGNTIWTRDPVVDPAANLSASIAVYPGNPNGNVAGNQGALGGSGASMVYDSANSLFYVCTTTGSAANAVWTQVGNTFSGAIAYTGNIAPSALGTDQNDYAPTGHASASIIRQDLSANVTLTGLDGDTNGAYKRIVNTSSAYYLTLSATSTASEAQHRFSLLADLILGPSQSVDLVYDGTNQRWRVRSTTGTLQGRTTLTDAATIAWDLAAGGPNFEVTLAGNRILGAFTNAIVGQRGLLTVIQDGTGGRTLDLTNAVYDFPGGVVGLVSSGASERTVYEYYVVSSTAMLLRRVWVEGRTSVGWYKEYDGGAVNFGSLVTQAHGLGRVPAHVSARLECTTTQGNWAVGDTTFINSLSAANSNIGSSIFANITNVFVAVGTGGLYIINKTTFAHLVITEASWRLYIRVWE